MELPERSMFSRGLSSGDAEHTSHRRSEEAHLSMVPWN